MRIDTTTADGAYLEAERRLAILAQREAETTLENARVRLHRALRHNGVDPEAVTKIELEGDEIVITLRSDSEPS